LQPLSDLVDLFLPRRCSACDRGLRPQERALCLHCLEDLPLTRFHDDPKNPVALAFAGRIPVVSATALLRFDGSGRVQRILHRLKYRGDTGVGHELGLMLGEQLTRSASFQGVDAVLAVPLHPAKERSRGYNQSQVIAEGIRAAWPLTDVRGSVRRVVRTNSQTRMDREQRWSNVSDAFLVRRPEAVRDRHVLLVDDVITTGATIGSLARTLTSLPGTTVSVVALAHA